MNEYFTPAIVPADPEANTTDLLLEPAGGHARRRPVRAADRRRRLERRSVAEFHRQVVALAKGLVAAGIKPGEKIGFMCKTRYEWTLVDFAAWFAGAVLVPIYETSAPAQIQFNLTDSGATALIVETADHFAKFDEVRSELPQVTKVWQLGLGDLDKLVAGGTEVTDDEIEKRRSAAKGSDLATLIYTSGSDRAPEGVHHLALELRRAEPQRRGRDGRGRRARVIHPAVHHDRARLRALHLDPRRAHRGQGRPPGRHEAAAAGARQLQADLLARRAARVREGLQLGGAEGRERRARQDLPRGSAMSPSTHSKALDAGSVPTGLKLKFALYDRLVYSKLRAAMGGNIKFAVSGSAPLGTYLGHFFRSLGVKILEGYGLTETTAPATVNLVSKFKIGTVGPALPGVGTQDRRRRRDPRQGHRRVRRLLEQRRPTAEVMEGEWFHTGDIGALDDDGYLTVTGRKKEIIVTAGGKNVAPAGLEDPIRSNSLISQVVVVGDQKPFISALITLDAEMLPVWLHNNGESADLTPEQACTNPKVRRRGAEGGGCRERPRLARRVDPQVRRSCPTTSPRPPATSRPR